MVSGSHVDESTRLMLKLFSAKQRNLSPMPKLAGSENQSSGYAVLLSSRVLSPLAHSVLLKQSLKVKLLESGCEASKCLQNRSA